MKKTVLVFGLISGVISAGMMLVTMPFTEHIGYDRALVAGLHQHCAVVSAGVLRDPVVSRQPRRAGRSVSPGRSASAS